LPAEEGVDLIALEMVDHPRYAEPAVEAALQAGLPVWLGVCVHSHDHGRSGETGPIITDEHRCVVALAQGDAFDAVCVMHTDLEDVGPVLVLVTDGWDGPLGPIRTTACGSGRTGSSGICPRSGSSSSRAGGALRESA
jgi:hypothetical protein